MRTVTARRRVGSGAASNSSRARGADAGEFDGEFKGYGATHAESDGEFDGSFDAPDTGYATGGGAAHERAGEPLRVCLACGEEDPSEALVGAECAHSEVAVFAEGPTDALVAAERVRRARAELAKALRALSSIARGAVTSGEAVIDEKPSASMPAAMTEPVECAACAERAASDASERVEGKRTKRAKRARSLTDEGAPTQAAFDFLASK